MKKLDNMPVWAYWGLWGINTRKVAMTYFIIALILSLAIIPFSIMMKDYLYLCVVLAPIWYWVSIKWADKNNAWNSEK